MAFDLDRLERLLEEMEPAEIEARFEPELDPAARAMLRHFAGMDQALAAVRDHAEPPDVLPLPRKRSWVWALPMAAVFLMGFFGLYTFMTGEDPLRRDETTGHLALQGEPVPERTDLKELEQANEAADLDRQSSDRRTTIQDLGHMSESSVPEPQPSLAPQEESSLLDGVAEPNIGNDRANSLQSSVEQTVPPPSSPGSVEGEVPVTKPRRLESKDGRTRAKKSLSDQPASEKAKPNRSVEPSEPTKSPPRRDKEESIAEIREEMDMEVANTPTEEQAVALAPAEKSEEGAPTALVGVEPESADDLVGSVAPAKSSKEAITSMKKKDQVDFGRSEGRSLLSDRERREPKPSPLDGRSLNLAKAKGPVASWIIRFQDFLGQPNLVSGRRLFTTEAMVRWSPISRQQLVSEDWLKIYLSKVSGAQAGWLAGGVRAEVISYQATSDAELTLALVRWWQVAQPESVREGSAATGTNSGYLEVTLNRAGRCIYMVER